MPATLSNELATHDQLETIGGLAYLFTLTDSFPRLDSIDSYIRIVCDKSLQRQLIRLNQSSISATVEDSAHAAELIADHEQRILSLGDANLFAPLKLPRTHRLLPRRPQRLPRPSRINP